MQASRCWSMRPYCENANCKPLARTADAQTVLGKHWIQSEAQSSGDASAYCCHGTLADGQCLPCVLPPCRAVGRGRVMRGQTDVAIGRPGALKEGWTSYSHPPFRATHPIT